MPIRLGRFADWLFLIFFGVCWGLSVPLSKTAMSTGHHPLAVIFWQLVIGAVALAMPVLFFRLPVPLHARYLVFCFGLALVGTLIPNTASFAAYANLPAGIVAIVIATVPMFALLFALSLRQERFELRRAVGIFLGVGALILIALPEARSPGAGALWFIGLALVAAAGYGAEGSYISRFEPKRTAPVVSLMVASVLGAPVAGIIAWQMGVFLDPTTIPFGAPEQAIVAGSIMHAIAYSGFIWLVGRAGPVFTSQIAYVVTLSAVSASVLILGERYPVTVLLALMLMVFGLWLVQPKPSVGAPKGATV